MGVLVLKMGAFFSKNGRKHEKVHFFSKKFLECLVGSKKSYTFASQLRNRRTLSSVGRAIDS